MLASGEQRTHPQQAPRPTKLLQSRLLLVAGAGEGAVVGGLISASRTSRALLLQKLAVPTRLWPELQDRRRPTSTLAPPGLFRRRQPVVVAAMAALGSRLAASHKSGLKAAPPVT